MITELLAAANKIIEQFNTMSDNDDSLKKLKEDLSLVQSTLLKLNPSIQKRSEFNEVSKAFDKVLKEIEKALKEMHSQGINAYLEAGNNKKDLESNQAYLLNGLQLWELTLNITQSNMDEARQQELLTEIEELEKLLNNLSVQGTVKRNEIFETFSKKFDGLEKKLEAFSENVSQQSQTPYTKIIVHSNNATYVDELGADFTYPEGTPDTTIKQLTELMKAQAMIQKDYGSSRTGKTEIEFKGNAPKIATWLPLRATVLERTREAGWSNNASTNTNTNTNTNNNSTAGTMGDVVSNLKK